MIQIGDFEIHLINDARILIDAGGPFGLVPRLLYSKYKQPDEMNRIYMDHHCLLVRTESKTIIVDTGIGTKVDPRIAAFMNLDQSDGGLVGGLARHGVQPEDVTLVINTHLHSDHCGGNTVLAEGGEVKPTFPNAEYVVQRLEYADASFPNERTRGTYYPFNYATLLATGQMRLLDGETEIMPGLRTVVTPGHTRAHQSVFFEQDGKAAIFVCDLASFAVHFAKLAWMTAYDVEPLITLETKRNWQKWALKHDALLIFMHDPDIPVGRLVGSGDKLEVIPAEG
jgi:glyoxylase-like metal-dependent hydrolase (beta-lactamase superfamily II)